jgi:recombination protein RecT
VLAKRYGGLEDINANVVFKGDEFIFETDGTTGKKRVIKHTQTIENFGSKEIIGAYAVMTMKDGTVKTEIMSMPQIKQAWEQGSMKGNSPAHRNFPDQMAMRTVINRACKLLIRGSDDTILYGDSKDVQDVEYTDVSDVVAGEIAENANKKTITIETPEPQKEQPKTPPQKEIHPAQDTATGMKNKSKIPF